MTTAQNYVTYIPPTKVEAENLAQDREGEQMQFRDFIIVTVIDVRGGQSVIYGNPELHDPGYSCQCSDVNKDGVINSGDIIGIVYYLYLNGKPIYAPIERGDANNDCIVDAGDIVYLINYCFFGGPFPECCWFPPQ